ncbi:hypothetical protein Ahy_A10g049536 [Arachis hypogaea]|uniref:Ribonuclease H n=1 Tax=Arachis hypogaea TaxID=3818 RepID=A0A445B7E3_ARAHY|nr:hypothetical protein Ahy_A10g049536 [Arachis hypogaea]
MKGGRYNYYVVRKGRVPGFYTKWVDCERQVSGFKGNEYKGFQVRREAVELLHSGGGSSVGHDNDLKARQDASLKMLKKIVETTKLTVVNFNYNRVRELELENSRLKEEVSALQSYLSRM